MASTTQRGDGDSVQKANSYIRAALQADDYGMASWWLDRAVSVLDDVGHSQTKYVRDAKDIVEALALGLPNREARALEARLINLLEDGVEREGPRAR